MNHKIQVGGNPISERKTHMAAAWLTDEELDALRQFDTCMVANAVETFNVRLHNTGFTDASIRCMFEDAPPMVGYAVTARLRSGNRPWWATSFMTGGISGMRFSRFRRPAMLVLEDEDIPPAAVHLSEICTPPS